MSVLGERAAVRLRLELFEAILRQDMGFFDEQRTGELVGRLTTDVGDFKHAFKNCVSQVCLSMCLCVHSWFNCNEIFLTRPAFL